MDMQNEEGCTTCIEKPWSIVSAGVWRIKRYWSPQCKWLTIMCSWKIMALSTEKAHGRQLVPGIHYLKRPITCYSSAFSLPMFSNTPGTQNRSLLNMPCMSIPLSVATIHSSHPPLLTPTHILWLQTSSYPSRNNSKFTLSMKQIPMTFLKEDSVTLSPSDPSLYSHYKTWFKVYNKWAWWQGKRI